MLLLREPKSDTIRRFLGEQGQLECTYRCIGATAGELPEGYVVDHTRVKLGEGKAVYAAAKSALESWQQFRLGWLNVWPANTPIRQGEVVAVVARALGCWWLNACRIVYLIDEERERKRFGFAYGTLPDHTGSGEERFLIEMNKDETVWYDILAYSRPNHALARIGYPYLRRVQKRFGEDSATAMKQTVEFALKIEAKV